MGKEDFHFAGDIVNATADEIIIALSAFPYSAWKKSDAEVLVNGNSFDMEIYSYNAPDMGRYNFLIGGNIDGTRSEVMQRLQEMADQFEKRNLVYNFEIYPSDNPDERTVICHPKF